MKIGCLQADFYLHGCNSLKEKRQRLGRLRDKFGKQTGLAVCESAFPDDLRRAQWSFVACAGSAVVVRQMFSDVEEYLTTAVDAEVTQLNREWLA